MAIYLIKSFIAYLFSSSMEFEKNWYRIMVYATEIRGIRIISSNKQTVLNMNIV